MTSRELSLPSGERLSVDSAGHIMGRHTDGREMSRLELNLMFVDNQQAINLWRNAELSLRNRDLAQRLLADFDPWRGLALLVDKPMPPMPTLGGRLSAPPAMGREADTAPWSVARLDDLARHQQAYIGWLDGFAEARQARMAESQASLDASQDIRKAFHEGEAGSAHRQAVFRRALRAANWPATVSVSIDAPDSVVTARVRFRTETNPVRHLLDENGWTFETRPLGTTAASALRLRYQVAVTVAIGRILFAVDGLLDRLSIEGEGRAAGVDDVLSSEASIGRSDANILLPRQEAVLAHTLYVAIPAWMSCKAR